MNSKLKTVQIELLVVFCACIGGSLMFLAVGELVGMRTFIPNTGDDDAFLVYVKMFLLLVTLAAIPLALRLFKTGRVARQLEEHPLQALQQYGMTRIALLAFPLLLNAVVFETFNSVSNLYLYVITLLAMAFVVPTMDRCRQETNYVEEL